MILVGKDKNVIVNFSELDSVEIVGKEIRVFFKNDQTLVGEYDTEDDAYETMSNIIDAYIRNDKVIFL